jgi:hypothetical protein
MKDKPKASFLLMEKWKNNSEMISIYISNISHDILVYGHFIIISTIKQWDASYGSG